MSWTEVFGGQNIEPAQLNYSALALAANTDLYWTFEAQTGVPLATAKIDVTPSGAGFNLDLPDARLGSVGADIFIVNRGAHSFTVRDFMGGALQVVPSGESWLFYLRSNATQAGSWGTLPLGSGITTSRVDVPQGRLTLVASTPVAISDQVGKTAIFYTPYAGVGVPVFSGVFWEMLALSGDLTMTLDTTNQPIERLFDLFAFNNSGALQIGAGPSWIRSSTITVTIASPAVVTWNGHGLAEGAPIVFTTTGALPTGITAGTTYYVGRSPAANAFNISTSVANAAAGTFVNTSGSQSGVHTGTNRTTSRGTGAGTTEIAMLNGIWTNAQSISLFNGAGAAIATVAANRATYLGTFYTTAAGQTGTAFTPAAAAGGTNNVLGLYNAYNRVRTVARSRDSTVSWTYNSTTWRSSNNNVASRVTYVDGLAQSVVNGVRQINFQTTNTNAAIGMNRNSTDQAPAQCSAAGSAGATNGGAFVRDGWLPQLGLSYIQAVESAISGVPTFAATEAAPTRAHEGLWVELEA